MSPENAKVIYEFVSKAGDSLKGKLFPNDEHPARNSYAHLWHSIKEKFGASYKDVADDRFDELLAFVKQVADDANSSTTKV